MFYAIDCEFIEDGITIELMSIALVAEDGREYYAQDKSCMLSRASQWVKDNVIPHLDEHSWKVRSQIRRDILSFMDIEKYGTPKLVGYYSAYDHVAFCQLFGTMMNLPQGFPMYTHDLRQHLDMIGMKDVSQPDSIHHSLDDARWIATHCHRLKELGEI